MDRPEARRPTGARQHDPGSAGVPLRGALPRRRSREAGASGTGARHRIEGGPITPAGIPVVSLSAPVPARDAYATDRLPIVGGPLDPGAGRVDTPFTLANNGPDTDKLPIVSADAPPPEAPAPDEWASSEPPAPTGSVWPTSSWFEPHRPETARHAAASDTDRPEPVRSATRRRESTPPQQEPARAESGSTRPNIGAATAAASESATPPASADTGWSDRYTADWEPRPAPDYNGDDEVFARMIDRSKRRRAPRWVAPLAASVAGAILIGIGYFQFGGPAPESTSSSTTLATVAAPAPAVGQCPTEQIGGLVRGNGPGGTDSGVSAILAFQHAYYVARSGDQARTLVAGDAALPTGAQIQSGIDTIPVGTTHCLDITPGAFAGQYLVTITEYRPDEVPIVYNPQLVGTTKVGAKTLITSIGPVR
ncbi:hypothetical protein [Nocardia caishijiensis]|uniref:DUF8176 domain-containing protein n=1 Tax=Nocardia caishijiensis TaxID=184756 RepID=A0ABQ6YP96_9NOCA|nr:hypothetical protein [Nocardia caishijiensis]KAF0847261.1 hypothetical protein FNL39_103158 [Nocardia caishijiensis]